MTVVGSAADGFEAVLLPESFGHRSCSWTCPCRAWTALTATRMIVTEDPTIQVLVLTSFADREQVTNALDAGAWGTC